jgi:hypothetical protein
MSPRDEDSLANSWVNERERGRERRKTCLLTLLPKVTDMTLTLYKCVSVCQL